MFHLYLFYITLILLPSQLGWHLWPQWAYVLGRRIDYLSPTVYLTDIFILLTIISWIVSFRINKIIIKKYQRYLIYVISLLLIVFVNVLFSVNKIVTILSWLRVSEFIFLGIYIVKTKVDFRTLTKILLIPILYSSIVGIWQFINQSSVGGIFRFLGERTFDLSTSGIARFDFCLPNYNCPQILRSYSTFPHPNVFAGFLSLILPIVIYDYLNNNSNRRFKIFEILTFFLGTIALIFTFSRSGIIVFLFLMSVIFYKKGTKYTSMIIIGLIIIFLVLILKNNFLNSESVLVRSDLITASSKIFIKYAFTGSGLGTFLIKLSEYLVSRQIYYLQPVHNIYLLIASETGLCGLLVFGVFIFLTFKKLLLFPILKNRFFKIALLTSMLTLGLFDHYFLTLEQGLFLFTLLYFYILI
jgi:hypothetical protein